MQQKGNKRVVTFQTTAALNPSNRATVHHDYKRQLAVQQKQKQNDSEEVKSDDREEVGPGKLTQQLSFAQSGSVFGKWAINYSEPFDSNKRFQMRLKFVSQVQQANHELRQQQFEKFRLPQRDNFYGRVNDVVRNPGEIQIKKAHYCVYVGIVAADEQQQHELSLQNQQQFVEWPATGNQICLKCKEAHSRKEFASVGKINKSMGSIFASGIIIDIDACVAQNHFLIADANQNIVLQSLYDFRQDAHHIQNWRFLVASHTASQLKVQFSKNK